MKNYFLPFIFGVNLLTLSCQSSKKTHSYQMKFDKSKNTQELLTANCFTENDLNYFAPNLSLLLDNSSKAPFANVSINKIIVDSLCNGFYYFQIYIENTPVPYYSEGMHYGIFYKMDDKILIFESSNTGHNTEIINSIQSDFIQKFGESTFEKYYNYMLNGYIFL